MDATKIYDNIVRGRRSIRGFRSEPLSKELIRDILDTALRAPSSLNTQPWNFVVVTGDPLDRIRAGNVDRTLSKIPSSREFRTSEVYEGVHRERQVGIARRLFAAMGIAREDRESRKQWGLRGLRQFDAPVSIIVTFDRVLIGNDIAPFDCGAVTNALVNAAWARGVGCVINSQGIMQSPVVREHAYVPDDQIIMICVAMGFPDDQFPANAVISDRKSVDECTTFVGFE